MSDGRKNFCCTPPCAECELATELAEERTLHQQLREAVKQWRNATESRLRLLDSRGEAGKSMLKADADLCAALYRSELRASDDGASGPENLQIREAGQQ